MLSFVVEKLCRCSYIEGGVAAFRNEHTLVWLLASASRAESEAIGCEIYFGRVVNTPTL